MKATFFYDIRFLEEGNRKYSHFGVSNQLADRYLQIFDEFTYVGRKEKLEENNKKYIDSKYEITKFKVITYEPQYSNIIKTIRKEIENTDFCIIRLPSTIGTIVQKECKKQKKPYMVEVVGNIFESLWYHSMTKKIFAIPWHIMTKYTIKNSECVSYITESYLQKCYPTKYNSFSGIANVSLEKNDINLLEERIKKIENREISNIINIGLIGSLDVNYKGQNTAIKAISLVQKKYPNVYLNLLGPGNNERWKKFCEKYNVEKNVKFCGSLPGGEPVLKWLDSMDIYIQPSLTEGHGRAVVEAMSRGCATFASNTGGLVDSVDKEYLFEKKSEKELAELIIKYIKNKEFAIEASITSYKNSEKYQKEIIEEKRKNAYEKAIKYWKIKEK